MKNRFIKSLVVPLFLIAQSVCAQSDSTKYDDLSLADLMNVKISVASIKELTPRESPGVVYYINSEDICESGARDLIDVLRMVPGFDFGVDVEGVVGLGVRGNWAHEGKVLMLIDGQEMNEGLYSTLQFGNHYPIESIKRIEIIRGPGSAIYGGNAEYAVINIITNDAKHLNGVRISGSYGVVNNVNSHHSFNLEAGGEVKDVLISISATGIQGIRSEKNYTDVFGSSYNMMNQSQLNNGFVNVGIAYKKLKVRAIADHYFTTARDEYQEILSKPVPLSFKSYFLEIKNEFIISSSFKIIPRINIKQHTPWNYNQTDPDRIDGTPFNITNQRYQATVLTCYDPVEQLSVNTGIEAFSDISKNNIDGELFPTTNSNTLKYRNAAGFAQVLYKHRFANLTVGARYNVNTIYDASFVPRLGLTKLIGAFHVKFLYSKAFRSPSTQNIAPSPHIKPEKTTVTELETGLQINSSMYIAANAYYINTKNVIAYYYDTVTDFDGYNNLPKSGTQGFEIVFKYKKPWGHLDFSGSLYSANMHPSITNGVPGHRDYLLAFPTLQWSVNTGFNLSNHLTWNVNASILGKRYTITSVSINDGSPIYSEFSQSCKLNTFISYRDAGLRGLTVGAGVYNVLDQNQFYLQPYNSLHAPLPALGRELTIKISYTFKR